MIQFIDNYSLEHFQQIQAQSPKSEGEKGLSSYSVHNTSCDCELQACDLEKLFSTYIATMNAKESISDLEELQFLNLQLQDLTLLGL